MNWIALNEMDQLDQIREQSKEKVVLIFKHSINCSISRTALDRLERNWKEAEMSSVSPYFLDLISYRNVSNQVAIQFGITHESPQLLIIKNEAVVYDCSHLDIDYASLKKELDKVTVKN